jgi:hypothetical protein
MFGLVLDMESLMQLSYFCYSIGLPDGSNNPRQRGDGKYIVTLTKTVRARGPGQQRHGRNPGLCSEGLADHGLSETPENG